MTDLVTPTSSTLDTILSLIKRKEAHIKEGKQLARLFHIYKEELSQVEKELHRTRDGNIMTVSDMSSDHLIQTIKCYMTDGTLNNVPSKYLSEAKKRNLIDRILEIEMVIESNDPLGL